MGGSYRKDNNMSDFVNVLGAGLRGVATGLNNFATYSAKSAARANAVSAGAQAAAAKFNQSSADNANNINIADCQILRSHIKIISPSIGISRKNGKSLSLIVL